MIAPTIQTSGPIDQTETTIHYLIWGSLHEERTNLQSYHKFDAPCIDIE